MYYNNSRKSMKKVRSGLGYKKNKKANAIIDGIMVIVVLFAFLIMTFFGQYILNMYNDDVSADVDMSNTSKEIVSEHNTRYTSLFDNFFLVIFIFVWALVLIASFKIDTHPVFFIFTLILLIVVFIIAAELGNTYEELVSDAELSGIAVQYTIANYIMTHLLTVAIVIGFSIVLVLFGKNRMGT